MIDVLYMYYIYTLYCIYIYNLQFIHRDHKNVTMTSIIHKIISINDYETMLLLDVYIYIY